jgi:HD superfamily phosphohydrolase
MAERIYRDSVHNIIRLDLDGDEGRLLSELIDTPEFQRLRRVRQLGLAHFAYQGAEHSRFTHSLGAMHLATRILSKLSSKYEISDADRIAVRCAALLHDVGHGAFSHVIEPILDFHHEDFTIAAVESEETAIGRRLREFDGGLPRRVASIIRGDFRPLALSQIVSSQLDADRMDYLLRDSLMTGVKYGIFDLEWILKSLEIDQENDRLYVSARGLYAVEDYLQARYYMYRQVYFHRTLRSAESVLRSLLHRAVSLFKEGKNVFVVENTPFDRVFRGMRFSLSEHLSFDDADVLFHIKCWTRSDDAILADLSRRFLDRDLFAAFDLDMPDDTHESFLSEAKRVIAEKGFDPDYYFVEDKAGDIPHYFYATDQSKPKDLIHVEDGFARPRIREISEVSAAVRGLQKGYRIHRINFPAELKDDVARIYHK